MFLPELGKQIQGERNITSNNRVIRISAGSNNRESTVMPNIVLLNIIPTVPNLLRLKNSLKSYLALKFFPPLLTEINALNVEFQDLFSRK